MEADNTKFPHGIKDTAKKIKDLGLKPGIWISPFLADPYSDLVKNHPEFYVKEENKFVNGLKFSVMDGLFGIEKYIINLQDTNARNYIEHCIDYLLAECKFELLKLDFLYSIYFDPSLTIEEADTILHEFLKEIKNKYPHVYTIASGCPLIPAVGVVDSMRIGQDITYYPIHNIPILYRIVNKLLLHEALKSTAKREWTKSLWNLDCDVLVCRGEIGWSDSQILRWRDTIKNSNGNIFLGDNMISLPDNNYEKYVYPLFQEY